MTVIWAGTFDPAFSRNLKLARLLELIGAEVEVIQEDLWSGDRIALAGKPTSKVLWAAGIAYPRLLWRLIRGSRPDLYLVSYPGWLDVPFIRLAAWIKRCPMVFDPFMSLYDTMISDRGLRSPKSMLARLTRLLDRWSLRLADLVIADTGPQLEFYEQLAGRLRNPGLVIPVGTDDTVFTQEGAGSERGDLVAFHGKLVPLQGVTTIVEAAAILERDGIRTLIIGDGQDRPALDAALRRTGAGVERRGMVPLVELPGLLGRASVCLGVFGRSDKAGRVVPHKVFDALALGRPVVTRDGEAIRSLFREGEVVTVPPDDPMALAEAIRGLFEDPELRGRVAAAGHAAYMERFHERALAPLLRIALDTALRSRGGGDGKLAAPQPPGPDQEIEQTDGGQFDHGDP